MISTLALVCVMALGQAGESAPDAESLAAKVKSLVGRQGLGHEEMAKRDEAEKALIGLGPEVLAHLPAVTPRMSAEDQVRLKRVRKVLEDGVVATAVKPSAVTLTGEMKLSQAMAQISKQTGNKLIDYRERFNQEGADPTIKVN